MSKNNTSIRNTKVLACCALFIAISIICGKYLKVSVGEIMRFSLENLTVILSGILFGPVSGALVAVLADILGCILVGFSINPIVTLGAASIGIISGVVSKLCNKLPLAFKLSLTVFVSHIIGSVILKTIGLADWYAVELGISFNVLLLWRLVNYIIVGFTEYVILLILLSRKGFTKQINTIIQK